MPPPAINAEHSPEFEELAGLSALRLLEGDELARFDQHAATCVRCQLIVRLDRRTLERLSLAAPEMDPSPDFKARLLERAATEVALRPEPAAVAVAPAAPARGKILPFRTRSRWISLIAAVLVLGVATGSVATYMNQVVATYTLTGNAPGEARVIVRRSGAAELDMRGVPSPGAGFVYAAWVIPPGQAPVAAGTTPTGDAQLPIPRDLHGDTVAITREPAPGGPAPTTTPLMAAVIA